LNPPLLITIRVLSGFLLCLPIWGQPTTSHQLFDDTSYWELPDDGFPSVSDAQKDEKNEKLKSVNQV